MRKIIYILFLFLIGCGTENMPSYVLNVNVQPSEAGSVSPTTGEYDEGEEVNVSAAPNEHWVFDRWQGGATGSQNPTSIVMNSDMNVTAIFVKKEYPLSINITGQGTVNESVVQAKDYEHGTTVELEAVPSEGWDFVNWKNDLTGNENPVQITVDGEITVEALFEIQTFPLFVEVNGSGNVDISPDKEQYDYNEEIEFTANPATGWQFSHWEGGAEGDDNPLTYQIQAETTITTVFTQQTYQVNVTSNEGGSVSTSLVSGNEVDSRYTHGSEIEVKATPNDNYDFSGWEGDVTSDNNPLSVTVESNLSINALFDKQCIEPEECVGANFYASVIVGNYVFDSTLNIFNDLPEPILLTEIYIRRGGGEFAAQNDDVGEEVAPGNGISFSADYLPQPTVEEFSDFYAEIFFKYKGETYKLIESGSVSTFKGNKNISRIPLTK